MLDDGEEGGVRLWHLVKASEESELPKHRRGSVRERGGERAKAIPEIYLTRLLSMKVREKCMVSKMILLQTFSGRAQTKTTLMTSLEEK